MAHTRINGVYLTDNEISRLLREYAASGGYQTTAIVVDITNTLYKVTGRLERRTLSILVSLNFEGKFSVLALRIVVRSFNYLFSWARTVDCQLIQLRV
jgi:hypothetical protein